MVPVFRELTDQQDCGGGGGARQQLNTAKEIVEKASEKVSWVDVGVDKVRPEA